MRKLLVLAAGAIAGTVMLAAPANAITLSAPAGLAAAGEAANPVQQVRTVCRSYWNGYRWRQRCYRTAPRYYRGYSYRPYRHVYRAPYRSHRAYRGYRSHYGYRW